MKKNACMLVGLFSGSGGGIANFPTLIAVYLNRLPLSFGYNGQGFLVIPANVQITFLISVFFNQFNNKIGYLPIVADKFDPG